MLFINSSLDKLVKNLSDNNFKYLTEEYGSKNLECLKKKVFILISTWTILSTWTRFNEEKLPDKEYFYRSVKNGKTGENVEKLDGHISDKEYLTCKKVWDVFKIKNLDD